MNAGMKEDALREPELRIRNKKKMNDEAMK
jgi:hypothetical protein